MAVLLSEWTKFRTVRSTFWAILVMIVLVIGIGVLASEVAAHATAPVVTADDATALGLGGTLAGQVAMCVLGALAITTEFGSGMFKVSVTAVPNRLVLITTKLFVLVVTAFAASLAAALISAKVSWAIVKKYAVGTSGGASWSQILGAATYLTLIAVAAFGIGLMIRSSAGTISILLGVLLAVWIIVNLIPGSTGANLRRFHPMAFAFAMIVPSSRTDATTSVQLFAPWTGMLILLGYGLVLTVIGAALATARDA